MTKARGGHARTPTTEEKLVSWKSIAGYFGCDERTAKRWEQERRLPVHRAPGGKRSGVFAYTAELESWLRTGLQEMDLQSSAMASEALSSGMSVQPAAIESDGSCPAESARLHTRPSYRWPMRIASGMAVLFFVTAVLLIEKSRHAISLESSSFNASSTSVRHVPAAGAEELYLKGRYDWNLRTADSLAKSIDEYTEAIVKDPSYAEPYAGLAESYVLLPQYAHGDLGEAFKRAKDAADRAIELDPNLAAAHRAKAFALFFWDWDIPGSDAEFRRAIALDPNSAETHQWYASTLLSRLEGAECLRQIDEALRLNPTSAAIATDAALMHQEFGDDPDASVRRLQEFEQTQPTLLTPSSFLSAIYFANGDFPAYITELHRIASITHQTDDIAMAEAAARGWARGGKVGLLRERAKVLKRAFVRGTETGFVLGQTYVSLGRPQDALPYFQASLHEHFNQLITMQECNWAKKLSADSGYAALFAEIREQMHGRVAQPVVLPTAFRIPN